MLAQMNIPHSMEMRQDERQRAERREFALGSIRRELTAHPDGIPIVDLFDIVREDVKRHFDVDCYTWDNFDNHMRIISVSGKMARLLREVG